MVVKKDKDENKDEDDSGNDFDAKKQYRKNRGGDN